MKEEEAIYSDDNDFPGDQDFDEKGIYTENKDLYSRSEPIPESKTVPDYILNIKSEFNEQIQESSTDEHQIVSDKYSNLFCNSKRSVKESKNKENFGVLTPTQKIIRSKEDNGEVKKEFLLLDKLTANHLKNKNKCQEIQTTQEFQEFHEFPILLNHPPFGFKYRSDKIHSFNHNLKEGTSSFESKHENEGINLESINPSQSFKISTINNNLNSIQDSVFIRKENLYPKSKSKDPIYFSYINSNKDSQLNTKNHKTKNVSSINNLKRNYYFNINNLKKKNRNFKNKFDNSKISKEEVILKNPREINSDSSFFHLYQPVNNVSIRNHLYSSNANNIHYQNNNTNKKKYDKTINQSNYYTSCKTKSPKINWKRSSPSPDQFIRINSAFKINPRNSCLGYPSQSFQPFSKTNTTNISRRPDKILDNYIKEFEDEFSGYSRDPNSLKLSFKELKELFDRLHLLNSRLKNENQMQLLNKFWKFLGGEKEEYICKEYIHKLLKTILRLSPIRFIAKSQMKKSNESSINNICEDKNINFNQFYKIVNGKIIFNDDNLFLLSEYFKEFYINLLFYLESLKKSNRNSEIKHTELTSYRFSRFNSNSVKKFENNDSNLTRNKLISLSKKKSLGSKQSYPINIKPQNDSFHNKFPTHFSQRKFNEVLPKSSLSYSERNLNLNLNSNSNCNSNTKSNKINNSNKCLNSLLINSSNPPSAQNACSHSGRNSIFKNLDLKNFVSISNNFTKKKSCEKNEINSNRKINNINRENKTKKQQKIVPAAKNFGNTNTDINHIFKNHKVKHQDIYNENLKYPLIENIINREPKIAITKPQSLSQNEIFLEDIEKNLGMMKLNSEYLGQNKNYFSNQIIGDNSINVEKQSDKAPLLFVDIELDNNVSERITVFEGETIDEIAKQFSEKYNLPENKLREVRNLLKKSIEQMIEALLAETNKTEVINEEEHSDEEDKPNV